MRRIFSCLTLVLMLSCNDPQKELEGGFGLRVVVHESNALCPNSMPHEETLSVQRHCDNATSVTVCSQMPLCDAQRERIRALAEACSTLPTHSDDLPEC